MTRFGAYGNLDENTQWPGRLLFLIIFGMGCSQSLAQCKEWKWPADKANAQEKFALFQDAVHGKLYRQAVPYLNWFLAKAPDLNVAVYIRGAEIYDALAKTEKDPLIKKRFADSLMIIYDLRIRRCGDAGAVLNRKAIAYFKYNINGPAPEKVLALMDSAVNLNRENIMEATLVPYMESVVVTRIKTKRLGDEDVMRRYDLLREIIAKKQKTATEKERASLTSDLAKIDELLLKAIRIDCAFVTAHFGPKFREQPDDEALARKVFSYLLVANCLDDPLWLASGEALFKHERDFGLAKNLGLKFYATDSLDKARHYFSESLKLAPSHVDSADVYTYLGSLAAREGHRPEARSMFQHALAADPAHKEAFDKIGDLYYNSFKQCSHESSVADDRLVYLLAYDYYKKAGDREKMELAMKAFPSREEIFLMNYSTGQKIHVGCWIDEDTTLRTRD
jgi:tetratricopeptide (TPR) repeat protein